MKKILIVMLSVILLSISLAGCSKTDCVWCGEEKWCGTMTVWGEEVPVCKDCEREIEKIREEMLGE